MIIVLDSLYEDDTVGLTLKKNSIKSDNVNMTSFIFF